jgi:Na+-translocating ferredoxin:NAD+ oxidoreductase RNF subunit RnfB
MNINTSLDQIFIDKINTIQAQTHQDIKQILQTAIDLYYQQIQQQENDPLAILKQSDFIGCGECGPDLSSTYKAKLKTTLK